MRIVRVIRDTWGRKQSSGVVLVHDADGTILFTAQSLERGWLNNQRNISCIPAGVYDLRLEYSPRFKRNLWEVYGVPDRSECKFHAANYWHQLNGCISLGFDQFDINNDGLVDNTSSRDAMRAFHKAMGSYKEAQIRVINDRF